MLCTEGTEDTDSTSTDAHDIDTILFHFYLWILRLSAIQEIMSDSLTHSVNNIGLRDASASKNLPILRCENQKKNVFGG